MFMPDSRLQDPFAPDTFLSFKYGQVITLVSSGFGDDFLVGYLGRHEDITDASVAGYLPAQRDSEAMFELYSAHVARVPKGFTHRINKTGRVYYYYTTGKKKSVWKMPMAPTPVAGPRATPRSAFSKRSVPGHSAFSKASVEERSALAASAIASARRTVFNNKKNKKSMKKIAAPVAAARSSKGGTSGMKSEKKEKDEKKKKKKRSSKGGSSGMKSEKNEKDEKKKKKGKKKMQTSKTSGKATTAIASKADALPGAFKVGQRVELHGNLDFFLLLFFGMTRAWV